jgi:hypothetical protein
MLKKFILLSLSLVLNACATSENYINQLNQEIGQTSHQLIGKYGQPSKVKKLADGTEIITYISINQQVLPDPNYSFNNDFLTEDEMFYPFTYGGNIIPVGSFMGEIITDYCKTDFYIKNNLVTSWQYKGNSCVAM